MKDTSFLTSPLQLKEASLFSYHMVSPSTIYDAPANYTRDEKSKTFFFTNHSIPRVLSDVSSKIIELLASALVH